MTKKQPKPKNKLNIVAVVSIFTSLLQALVFCYVIYHAANYEGGFGDIFYVPLYLLLGVVNTGLFISLVRTGRKKYKYNEVAVSKMLYMATVLAILIFYTIIALLEK